MRIRTVLAVLPGLFLVGTLAAAEPAPQPTQPTISLTLIPPSLVTDKITLETRGAVWNRADVARTFEVSLYLDEETQPALLHREQVKLAAGAAGAVTFRMPTTDLAGKHRILIVARDGAEVRRMERPIEILSSTVPSTRTLGGAWVDIYHHSEGEGRYFNEEMARMTGPEWRELVRAMHEVRMDILVITMLFQNPTHRGKHTIERDGYHGKAYYPSKLFPGRMPIACPDPLEEILSEADRLGMHVLPGIGCYAFFDFGRGSLHWHKKVAAEIWQRYGHHPSFYGWYVSEEKDGGLGDEAERRELPEFFREFTSFVRRLAPDKPVMLATNCFHLRGAEDAYRQLLPHVDILSPFGFHRMPADDLTGEEAAKLLTGLCDRAGCHLWMDLETFVFHAGGALYPRPVGGLISDVRRFPEFEKVLCYQFPGLMSGPAMTRQPGGKPSVKLFLDYQRFLREGPDAWKVRHAALDKPVALEHRYEAQYSGGGADALSDGRRAISDYSDPAWQGVWERDLVATIDLGRTLPIRQLALGCLQETAAGIYLPIKVRFEVSTEGKTFRPIGDAEHDVAPSEAGPLIHRFKLEVPKTSARFVRVTAQNVGKIPPGNTAQGQKAWLFADELEVNPLAPPDSKPIPNP